MGWRAIMMVQCNECVTPNRSIMLRNLLSRDACVNPISDLAGFLVNWQDWQTWIFQRAISF